MWLTFAAGVLVLAGAFALGAGVDFLAASFFSDEGLLADRVSFFGSAAVFFDFDCVMIGYNHAHGGVRALHTHGAQDGGV